MGVSINTSTSCCEHTEQFVVKQYNFILCMIYNAMPLYHSYMASNGLNVASARQVPLEYVQCTHH